MANLPELKEFVGDLQTFRSKTMSYMNEMNSLAAKIGNKSTQQIVDMGGNTDLVSVYEQCKSVYVKIKAIIDKEKDNLPDDTEIS